MTTPVKRKPTDNEIIAQIADGEAYSIGGIVWMLERNAHVKTSETTVKPLVLALVAAGKLAPVSYEVNDGALSLVRGRYRQNATYYGLADAVSQAHNAYYERVRLRNIAAAAAAELRNAEPPDVLAGAEITPRLDGRVSISVSPDVAKRLWGLS